MSRILFVLLCCYVLEVQAIVLPEQPQQPEQQETKKATTNKPLSPKAQSKSTEKQPSSSNSPSSKTQNISEPAKTVLASPSKASIGFYQASINENYDMMELYLQQGADINCLNCTDRGQTTALYRALTRNNAWNFQLADWMIQRGADINIPAISYQSTGKTLVMSAADYDIPNLSALDYLIKRGADVKAVDSIGQNALHYFQRWDLIGRDADGERTNKIVAFIDQLIQHGIDVNSQDKSGITQLMNAAKSCSPTAVKLLLSYGANPALSNKLGQSALDIAIDRATRSGQGDGCNTVVKVLANPQQASRTPASLTDNTQQNISPEKNISQTQSMPAQDAANFAGTYSGTYIGSDSGSFQVTILQDGTAKLDGRSNQVGATFTGEGKISPDGSVAVGSASTGSTFTGSIGPSGVLSGTWKNTAHNQAGSFQGSKGAATATKPLQAIKGGLQLLNSILKPR